MKKIRNIVSIMLALIIVMTCVGTVLAAEGDSYTVKLTADKTNVKAGETVTVTITLDNINIQSGEKGLGTLEGQLVYDKSAFELKKFKGAEGWDNPTENEGTFVTVVSDGKIRTSTETVATMEFEVKANATAGEKTIKITKCKSSNGVGMVTASDATLPITIPGETNTNTKTNTTSGNTVTIKDITNTGSTTKTNSTKANTTTVAQGNIPHAGLASTAVSVLVIAGIAGVASYIRYKNIKLK